jgi:hypothetical protein
MTTGGRGVPSMAAEDRVASVRRRGLQTAGDETGHAPEIQFADGVPIPPSVRPVIVLSGTDYEIGYQWYRQYAQIFGRWMLQDLQCEISDAELAALKASQYYIRRHTPEFIDMMKGMAAGATVSGVPLSYEQVLACFTGKKPFPGTEPAGSDDEVLPPGCSGLSAWGSTTTDGRLLCVGIGDDATVKFEVTVVVFPAEGEGNGFVLSPYTMGLSPCHPGMNDKGLVYVHHGAGNPGNEKQGWGVPEGAYGVPNTFAIMHTLRYADTAAEALELQLSYPGKKGGHWVDTSGDAFVLECRDPLVVRRPGDAGETDFLYSTNNVVKRSRELEKFLPPHSTLPTRYIEHAGYLYAMASLSSIPRNLGIWNMLHNYHGLVDVEFLKMMCRFPGAPPDYASLEEADAAYEETRAAGWDCKIGNMANEMVGIMVPDERLFYISSFCVGKVSMPHHPRGHLYPVAPTFSFFQLELASDPAAVVAAARERGRYDLYYANRELRKLTCWDVPYAPLSEAFDKAATEWIKGDHYEGKAAKASEDESVLCYGKALRAFTRCQAHANQVHESLVPPPVDPEGLGLREWLGPWGDWATARGETV